MKSIKLGIYSLSYLKYTNHLTVLSSLLHRLSKINNEGVALPFLSDYLESNGFDRKNYKIFSVNDSYISVISYFYKYHLTIGYNKQKCLDFLFYFEDIQSFITVNDKNTIFSIKNLNEDFLIFHNFGDDNIYIENKYFKNESKYNSIDFYNEENLNIMILEDDRNIPLYKILQHKNKLKEAILKLSTVNT